MKLAIIDADFILFYATVGNKVLDEFGNPKKDEKGNFVYIPKTEQEVFDSADQIISNILNFTKSTHYVGYLGNDKSFRYEIYPEYKAKRTAPKPEHFLELKKHLVSKWFFNLLSSIEADDAVNIVRQLMDGFIVSPDKDILKCVEGLHFNPKKMEWVDTSKYEAEKNFWTSMITGDTVDNIKGIPGSGEVFAQKLFSSVQNGDKLYSLVLEAYIDKFGEFTGISEFYKNYRLLKMLDESIEVNIVDINPIQYKI